MRVGCRLVILAMLVGGVANARKDSEALAILKVAIDNQKDLSAVAVNDALVKRHPSATTRSQT